jgi:molecular chaperone DnaK (HSP70)
MYLGKLPQIKVRFEKDADGILSVSASGNRKFENNSPLVSIQKSRNGGHV